MKVDFNKIPKTGSRTCWRIKARGKCEVWDLKGKREDEDQRKCGWIVRKTI